MSALYRSLSYDGTTLGLDLYVTKDDVLIDVVELEYQIYDISSDTKKTTPVQVLPEAVSTWYIADPATDAPTGDKLSTGRYLMRWVVPALQSLGTYEIRWRFKETAASEYLYHTEEFEIAVPPDSFTYPSVIASDTVQVYVDLVDARGVPVEGQTISIHSLNKPLAKSGYHVAMSRAPIALKTDAAGHAEANLVKGLEVRVVFEGTSYVRDLKIPETGPVDLLTLLSTSKDIFDVVTLDIPAAARSS